MLLVTHSDYIYQAIVPMFQILWVLATKGSQLLLSLVSRLPSPKWKKLLAQMIGSLWPVTYLWGCLNKRVAPSLLGGIISVGQFMFQNSLMGLRWNHTLASITSFLTSPCPCLPHLTLPSSRSSSWIHFSMKHLNKNHCLGFCF